jgi:hypothetical protein
MMQTPILHTSDDEVEIVEGEGTTASPVQHKAMRHQRTPAKDSQIIHTESTKSRYWVPCSNIDIYCEAQQGAHCGAHALHSVLHGNKIAGAPHYYYHPLITTSLQDARSAGTDSRHFTTMPHSEASGWYSVEALNDILYEHVLKPVALVRVIDILPGELYTKHDILQNPKDANQGIII